MIIALRFRNHELALTKRGVLYIKYRKGRITNGRFILRWPKHSRMYERVI